MDQADVLRKKGGVTRGALGLQQWDDLIQPDTGGIGTGSSGTAERAAKIGKGQAGRSEEE